MKTFKSVQLLGAALIALSFAGGAHAMEIHDGHVLRHFRHFHHTPAVPEADTWAMMAVGLGLVGLRLRRQKNGEK